MLENANFVVLAFWWLVQSCGGFFAAEGTRVFCCLGRNRRIVAKLPELLKTHRYGQCLQVTTRPVLSSRTFTHRVAFAVSSQSQVKRLGGSHLDCLGSTSVAAVGLVSLSPSSFRNAPD
jgi:hypothetical protein